MRAVGFSQYGGPDVISVVDIPTPQPAAGEVRVRVRAATVNPTDIGMRSGRQATTLDALPPPYVPGMEFAGTLDSGSPVLGIALPMRTGRGAQAEYVVVPAESVVPVPTGVSLEQAATLPMNGLTVRRALDLLDLRAGQTLLVTGAAGAVGGYAVQLGAL